MHIIPCALVFALASAGNTRRRSSCRIASPSAGPNGATRPVITTSALTGRLTGRDVLVIDIDDPAELRQDRRRHLGAHDPKRVASLQIIERELPRSISFGVDRAPSANRAPDAWLGFPCTTHTIHFQ